MRYLVLSLLLAAIIVAQAPKQTEVKKAPAMPAHPNVGIITGDCLGCHRAVTSELVADWEAGKHGSRMVPCITCHGALGPTFVRRPTATVCVSCHSVNVDSLRAPHMKGKTCFSCHTPHRLNPHKSLTSLHSQGAN